MNAFTLKAKLPLRRTGRKGRYELSSEPEADRMADRPKVPRVSRLMALAIHLDELIRSGAIKDQAEIARVGHVSRARVTQIMNLLYLAPDIQEQLLFLSAAKPGQDSLILADLQRIAAHIKWQSQQRLWRKLLVTCPASICSTHFKSTN